MKHPFSSFHQIAISYSLLSTIICMSFILSIRLLGNIVGIDEKVAVDGNDAIEKSSFKLSPAAARVSSSAPKTKKPAQKKKPSSPRKRLFNSHQSSVSEVSDLRLHKRGRVNKETAKDENFIVVDSDSDIENPNSLNESEQDDNGSQKLVTPSPHPSRRQSHQQRQSSNTPAPRYNSSRSTSQQGKFGASGRTKSSHFVNANNTAGKNTASKSRAVRNTTSSWFQQKKQQKTSQLTAFNSPKENPFATYSFDPNSIEKSLDSQAIRSTEPSIFPSNVAASNFTASKPRNSRTFRTPANRRKNASSSSRISSHDLLQRKANELNQHRHQTTMTIGYNEMSASDPFSQQSQFDFGAGTTQSVMTSRSQMNIPYEQQEQQTFAAGNRFTHEYEYGLGNYNQFDIPQQIPQRPGTATRSVMTSRSQLNIPYQQQEHFVQPQQFRRSPHFMQPQQSRFQPAYYDDSLSHCQFGAGAHDFVQQQGHFMQPQRSRFQPAYDNSLSHHQQFGGSHHTVQQQAQYQEFDQFSQSHQPFSQQQIPYRPGTSTGSVMTSRRQPLFASHPVQQEFHDGQPQLNGFQSNISQHCAQPPNNHSGAPPRLVNPYRQQTQVPQQIVVQNDAMHDEAASQSFEDAFF